MKATTSFLLCCALGSASACRDDEGSMTSAEDGLGDDPDDCDPGTPACECDFGMCLDPLVCLAGTCYWPPPSGDEGPSEESDDGSDDVTSGDPPECEQDDDCSGIRYCEDGSCASFYDDALWQVTVLYWAPPSCSDGGLSGNADLWWKLEIDGTLTGSSGFVQGGCPGAWATTACGWLGGGFVLYLYDAEVTTDTLVDILWFDANSDDEVDKFPLVPLSEGEYDGPSNGGGQVQIVFERVEGCE